ncbi:MAG: hypothetical protein ABI165_03840 [Bryobacteraceae bacterium]
MRSQEKENSGLKETNNGPSRTEVLIKVLGGLGLLLVMMTLQSCSKAEAGPNGGDLVTLNNGQVKAEVVANADTGEVMVHTWDQNVKTSQPIEAKPLVMGTGDQTIELQPQPTVSDPSGLCSRFYGQADWLRGGGMHHGWMSGAGQSRQEFAWNNCWRGGQSHSSMRSERYQFILI